MYIRMSEAERVFFEQFLRCCTNYMEFGSGGSTIRALQTIASSGRVFTVDSNIDWLNKVKTSAGERETQLRCHYVDIGPTGDGGTPIDPSRSADFRNYFTEPWAYIDTDAVDLYLIDGRFRVQCFIETARRCRGDAIVLVHDYASRPFYHFVERVARKIA